VILFEPISKLGWGFEEGDFHFVFNHKGTSTQGVPDKENYGFRYALCRFVGMDVIIRLRADFVFSVPVLDYIEAFRLQTKVPASYTSVLLGTIYAVSVSVRLHLSQKGRVNRL
jgi:hypothetical protein